MGLLQGTRKGTPGGLGHTGQVLIPDLGGRHTGVIYTETRWAVHLGSVHFAHISYTSVKKVSRGRCDVNLMESRGLGDHAS